MRINKVIGTLCIVVGIILIAMAAVLSGNRISLLINGTTAPGQVVSINVLIGAARGCSASSCSHPEVTFTAADGRRLQFLSRFGAPRPEFRVGDRVDVVYVPGPQPLAEINDFRRLWVSPMVTIALGLILIVGGLVYRNRKPPHPAGARVRVKSNRWLKQNGYPVEATVEAISRTMLRGDTPRPAWQIVATGPAPRGQKVLTFRSEPLGFDPSGSVAVGSQMTVLTDPDNPTDYWIDTSALESAKD